MALFKASCHCGAITAILETKVALSDFEPRACQCSFCHKHNVAAVSDPIGRLRIHLGAAAGPAYRFGMKITDFHVCGRCGIFVAASWLSEDNLMGVLNARAIDGVQGALRKPTSVSFEGESLTDRKARRLRNWTPTMVGD